MNHPIRLRQEERGQGILEYLLPLMLVGSSLTAVMKTFAIGLNSAFSRVGSSLGQYLAGGNQGGGGC